MKIAYNEKQLKFLQAVKELFREEQDEVEPNKKFEPPHWPVGVQSLIERQLNEDRRVEKQKWLLRKQYQRYVSTEIEGYEADADILFKIYLNFESREEMTNWLQQEKLPTPIEISKTGEVINQEIFTRIALKTQRDDLIFAITYSRPGPPTANCRVNTTITSTVVCDMPSLSAPPSIPV